MGRPVDVERAAREAHCQRSVTHAAREEIYVIHNGQLRPRAAQTRRSIVGIAIRSFDGFARSGMVGDLFRIYSTSLRDAAAFHWITLPDSAALIRWRVGDHGFVMDLSGEVPGRIGEALRDRGVREAMLGNEPPEAFDSWAVHAGGRSVLDAVEHGLDLPPAALDPSRGEP